VAQVTFTPTSDTYEISFTANASNIAMTNIATDQQTLFKIDNSSGNLCFVAFSANASVVANINHPTPGTGNSSPVIAVRTGDTAYINPNLGTRTGNVYVGAVSIGGTGNIFIQAGV